MANNAHKPDRLEIIDRVRKLICGGLWATLDAWNGRSGVFLRLSIQARSSTTLIFG
jgi:hypothetical protein